MRALSDIRTLAELFDWRVARTPRAGDVFLSFLPLSHTFERTAGYYLPVAAGCCVAFARSTKLLPQDLKTVRPTILISVPRIYERVIAATLSRPETRRAAAVLLFLQRGEWLSQESGHFFASISGLIRSNGSGNTMIEDLPLLDMSASVCR